MSASGHLLLDTALAKAVVSQSSAVPHTGNACFSTGTLRLIKSLLQAEKKMEQKRRGNKDTQTSDAKFDEQFKLGHQMAAKVTQCITPGNTDPVCCKCLTCVDHQPHDHAAIENAYCWLDSMTEGGLP